MSQTVQTIDLEIRFPIKPDSKLVELIQASSRIGLKIMAMRRQGLKVSDALRDIYYEADRKLKEALIKEFGISFEIVNCRWDTDQYLSRTEHAVILAPEG